MLGKQFTQCYPRSGIDVFIKFVDIWEKNWVARSRALIGKGLSIKIDTLLIYISNDRL